MIKKDIIIVSVIIVSLFTFLSITGTLNSGFHFVDDHEVIRIKHDLGNLSFGKTSEKWLKDDLKIRFRPLYFIHRILETKIFGTNFFMWSIYNGILACLAFTFFYLAIRGLNYSRLESIIFLIISFVGQQMAIWWRLGPNETIGLVFLGLSFYFMSLSLKFPDRKLYSILFAVLLILTSLCKESFIIIVPGIVVFKVLKEFYTKHDTIRSLIFNNFILLLPIVVVFLEVFAIKYIYTLNETIRSTGAESYLNIFSGIKKCIRPYLNNERILALAILIPVLGYLSHKGLFSFKSIILSALLFLFIVIPNFICKKWSLGTIFNTIYNRCCIPYYQHTK